MTDETVTETEKPKAWATTLHADLIARTVHSSITLASGGSVQIHLTDVDPGKAKAVLKAALRDAASAL